MTRLRGNNPLSGINALSLPPNYLLLEGYKVRLLGYGLGGSSRTPSSKVRFGPNANLGPVANRAPIIFAEFRVRDSEVNMLSLNKIRYVCQSTILPILEWDMKDGADRRNRKS